MNGILEESPSTAEWRPYASSVRAKHWYELFLSNPNDERRNLTWKGVFKDVDNTINFYSSMDEVVVNGNDEMDAVLTRDFAWYNQGRLLRWPCAGIRASWSRISARASRRTGGA